jgi:hypothetical protein
MCGWARAIMTWKSFIVPIRVSLAGELLSLFVLYVGIPAEPEASLIPPVPRAVRLLDYASNA